jgi:signal transduction histidine kinase
VVRWDSLNSETREQVRSGLLIGAVGIAAASAVIALLREAVAPVGLTALYLFAILPVAIRSGFVVAGLVAVASYVTFALLFVKPLDSFANESSDTAVALTISLVTAYVVSELARRAQSRAGEAEQARDALRRLADEQSALRRVATLVAQEAPTAEVFEAVTGEVGLQCDADLARMERFEPDGTVTAVAAWSRLGDVELAVGGHFLLEGASIATQVLQTGRPARVDSFTGASGPIAREAQSLGIHSSVGCPIVVSGRTWGVIAASMTRDAPFPPNTESRIADFTELTAAAVSNAEARADLVASRARVLTAADQARRRVERDLHDGAQQRLVHAIITLKLARRARDKGDESAWNIVGEALEFAEQANAELRQLAHGILPDALSRGGLQAGVESLVSHLRVPVDVAVAVDRLPREIEASAYFVVAEALTNVAKHSGAQRARVSAWLDAGALRVDVRDDGVGGARADGSGLVGLDDRVSTLGGQLLIESPLGGGTRIAATLPL